MLQCFTLYCVALLGCALLHFGAVQSLGAFACKVFCRILLLAFAWCCVALLHVSLLCTLCMRCPRVPVFVHCVALNCGALLWSAVLCIALFTLLCVGCIALLNCFMCFCIALVCIAALVIGLYSLLYSWTYLCIALPHIAVLCHVSLLIALRRVALQHVAIAQHCFGLHCHVVCASRCVLGLRFALKSFVVRCSLLNCCALFALHGFGLRHCALHLLLGTPLIAIISFCSFCFCQALLHFVLSCLDLFAW